MEKVELTPLAKRFIERIGKDAFGESDSLDSLKNASQEDIKETNKLAEVVLEFAKEELVK